MKFTRIAIALVTALALTAGAGLAVAQPPSKATICHNIEDTGEDVGDHEHPDFLGEHEHDIYEGTTMEVPEPSLDAHLAHGDLEVGCLDGFTVTFDGTTLHLHDADGDGVPEYVAERPY